MIKAVDTFRRLMAVGLALVAFLLLAGFSSFDGQEDTPSIEIQGTINEKQGKKILSMTINNWIEWRYFNSRTMFYFTHFQGWRCGIQSAAWGLKSDKLNKELPIAECNEENPNSIPIGASTYIFTDDFGFDSEANSETAQDSFIGLSEDSSNKESLVVDRIFVQLTYFDGSKSEVREFKAPQSALGPK
ncbi:hypothetical protein [Spartinivicinus ruber]|uniref:hypothetical protein n=1 Tax=Spartinivicinus ruber TaxID=2683272 RepID=UPI0013CFA2BD|nr:hypothetical protein [Spartinivicinus ruber]